MANPTDLSVITDFQAVLRGGPIVKHELLSHEWTKFSDLLDNWYKHVQSENTTSLYYQLLPILRNYHPQIKEYGMYLPVHAKGILAAILHHSCLFVHQKYYSVDQIQANLKHAEKAIQEDVKTCLDSELLETVKISAGSILELKHVANETPSMLSAALPTSSSVSPSTSTLVIPTGRSYQATSDPELMKEFSKALSGSLKGSQTWMKHASKVDLSKSYLTELEALNSKIVVQMSQISEADSSGKQGTILNVNHKKDGSSFEVKLFSHDCGAGAVYHKIGHLYFLVYSTDYPNKVTVYDLQKYLKESQPEQQTALKHSWDLKLKLPSPDDFVTEIKYFNRSFMLTVTSHRIVVLPEDFIAKKPELDLDFGFPIANGISYGI